MKMFLHQSLVAQIISGMLLGALLGHLAGPAVSELGQIGKVFIQLVKAIAVPLVFFAIIEALLTTQISIKSAKSLLGITFSNNCIAAAIGLSLSNYFQPGKALHLSSDMTNFQSSETLKPFLGKKLDLVQLLTSYCPDSIVRPFLENNLIAIVILAILIGAAGRSAMKKPGADGQQAQVFEHIIRFMLRLSEQLLQWLVKLVPFAVFAVTAKTVGEYGFQPFSALALYVAIGLLGLLIQSALIYPLWILLVGKLKLRDFFQVARKPLIYSFGTNSSLATLPLTLEALESLNISKSASRLGACIGTNLNNDGILLYEAMAVLFVAQASGIDLSLTQQLFAAFLCVIAAAGVAGIPEAGVVSLSLVLATVGLPLEILPLLLTVDWLIARARSVTNVMSDLTVSIALNAFEKSLSPAAE